MSYDDREMFNLKAINLFVPESSRSRYVETTFYFLVYSISFTTLQTERSKSLSSFQLDSDDIYE